MKSAIGRVRLDYTVSELAGRVRPGHSLVPAVGSDRSGLLIGSRSIQAFSVRSMLAREPSANSLATYRVGLVSVHISTMVALGSTSS